jgi:membrane protease YdiL (CAAX protease family)
MSEGASVPAAASRSLRRRAAGELSLIGVLTPIYLLLVPRDVVIYALTAAGFLAYVLIDARLLRNVIWPAPSTPLSLRRARAWRLVAGITLPFAALFFAMGLARGSTLLTPNLLPALVLYLAWATVQQTIFQVYLLGRLRILLPGHDPRLYALVNGLAYGAVHVPWGLLTLATAAAGILWSYSYQRDHRLLPIVVSHAVLAISYYSWAQDRDFIAEILARIG